MLEGEDGDKGGPGLAMSRKPVAAGAPSHSRCDPTERPSGSWRQQAAQLHQQSSGHSSGTHRRRLPKKNGFGSIMSPSAAAVRHSEATGGTDELDGSQTGHGETDARLEWTATARPRGGVPRQGRMPIARCYRHGIMIAEKLLRRMHTTLLHSNSPVLECKSHVERVCLRPGTRRLTRGDWPLRGGCRDRPGPLRRR